MIFISVDLPAPFSPISAWTWPRFNRNDTSSSASTPGKALRTFDTSSRYSAPGIAPLCLTISAVEGLMVAMALRPIRIFWRRLLRRLRRSPMSVLACDGPEALGRLGVSGRPHLAERIGETKRHAGSSVLLHELINVGRRHQLEGDIDLLLDRLARGESEGRVDGAFALTCGVLEHGDLEVASLHRSQRVLRRVDAADDRLLGVHAGRLHRLKSADRHFVVVGDDRVELHALR